MENVMLDKTDRLVLVLANESRRMRDAAERVDLVVKALALRRDVQVCPREVAQQDVDLSPQ